MSDVTLYTYFRSSAAYRVRIALALKGLSYQSACVHLLRDGGEQFNDSYCTLNPQALVPTLKIGNEVFTQSIAIIEYLDEVLPEPPLLAGSPATRAQIRSIALGIACDIHPLQNLRVREYLKTEQNCSGSQVNAWCQHWIMAGLLAIEKRLLALGMMKKCSFGDEPSLADICLIPQIYSALRYGCQLELVPHLLQIYHHCLSLPAFQAAAPECQPDACEA